MREPSAWLDGCRLTDLLAIAEGSGKSKSFQLDADF